MRVENPRRAGPSRKTRKETDRLTSLHDSVFEARSACSVLGPRKEERGRRGAPPEMGARVTRSARRSRAGDRGPDASRTRLLPGSLPTAACAVRSIVQAKGSRRLESGVGVRVPRTTRDDWALGGACATGSARRSVFRREVPNPGRGWRTL